MTTEILLIRHGEAAAKWGDDPDPGLSADGHKQANAVAEKLVATRDPSVTILSSPMRRARETAAPLAARLKTPVIVDDRYREVPAPVLFERRTQWIRQFMSQQWREQPESIRLWRDDILLALSELTTPTVIFTHFVVINAVVSALQQTDNVMVFQPYYTSITRIRIESSKLTLNALGESQASIVN